MLWVPLIYGLEVGALIPNLSPDHVQYLIPLGPALNMLWMIVFCFIHLLCNADFYGKGAGYNALAGRDCTRAVALWSLDEDDMISDVVR